MGLSSSQGRFLMLTGRKTDVEFQGQQVNQQRMVLASETEQLFNSMLTINVPTPPDRSKYAWDDAGDAAYELAFAQYEADKSTYDAQINTINAKTEAVHNADRKLELQLKNLDTQQQAIQTEVDAVQKVIDKNIDMTFKTFA